MQGLQPLDAQMQPMEVDKDMMYLSNKRVLLSNPGIKLDEVYYSQANSQVSLAEATYNTGRLSISLNQNSFNSQSQIVIPNQSLLENIYLHLEIPDVIANQTVCRGWGYAMIESISYLFGSSNVSQLTINGHSLWQEVALECESTEKRSYMWSLGGEEVLAPTGGNLEANLLLPFPWSSACGTRKKLPFDTSLLSSPITIQIRFNQASSIYGGSGVRPSAFLNATVYVQQGELTNRDQSMKFTLQRNPTLMLSYPFIHAQSFIPTRFTGKITAADPCNVVLQSFINADLLGISFGAVRASRLTPTGNSTPNPMSYDELENIQLLYNGQVMYLAPGRLDRLIAMSSTESPSWWHDSVVTAGSVAPFLSNPVNTTFCMIDFSRIRAICYDREFQNTWSISNQTLSLNFTTETTEEYILYCTYYYNGVAELQNGESRIYFS